MQSPSLEVFNRLGRTSLQMLLAFGCCLALFASLALISAPKHASARPASIKNSAGAMSLYVNPPPYNNILSLYISVDQNSTNTNPQWCTVGSFTSVTGSQQLYVGIVGYQHNNDSNISVEGFSGYNCTGTSYGPLPWTNFNWNATVNNCVADFSLQPYHMDGPGCPASPIGTN